MEATDAIEVTSDPPPRSRPRTASSSRASYWARGIARETVVARDRRVDLVQVYGNDLHVGSARAVTDGVTCAWIAGVLVVG